MKNLKVQLDILADWCALVLGFKRLDCVSWIWIDGLFYQRVESKVWRRL